MDNFYVTLPSNVINSDFNNTIANYKTKLASRLDISGPWEVGLSSISYTLSWYNLTQEETITVRYFDGGITKLAEDVKIPPGRYDTIDELISIINSQLTEYGAKIGIDMPELVYKAKSRVVSIKRSLYKNRLVFLELSLTLCRMLGFEKSKMDSDTGILLIRYETLLNAVPASERGSYFPATEPTDYERTYKASRPFELAGGYHSLFVYCDIVKPSLVGDSNVKLLRFVEIPPNYTYGQQVVLTYPDTHYIPILTNYFDTIEIDIKDDTGLNIPFEFGRTIVVLHFRKML